MTQVIIERMFQRRATSLAWESANPILAAGEIGVEILSDPAISPLVKMGNGILAWKDLPYLPVTAHSHSLSDLLQSGAADGDVPTWNAAQAQWLASAPSGGSSSGGILPVVTGEVLNGQPVFVYLDDGSLIHTQVA